MHSVKLSNKRLQQSIPERPGVYFFRNTHRVPVYIGKAINLQKRIMQHLTDATNPKEKKIRESSVSVDWRETNSEFEALLFEANCIKKYQPHYNSELKDDKSNVYLSLTREEYPRVILVRETAFSPESSLYHFGPLYSARVGRYLITTLRRIVPFSTAKSKERGPCFYSHLHQCEPCPGVIQRTRDEYEKRRLTLFYKKNIARLIRILSGGGSTVLRQMEREMSAFAQNHEYEKAALSRDRIAQLRFLFEHRFMIDERLEDPLFIQKERSDEQLELQNVLGIKEIKRIECFDISTFSAKQSVASCVVFEKGVANPREYRRFRIKGDPRFDPHMLREVLMRRFSHADWPWPDLIVLDGGGPQLRSVVPTLKHRFSTIPPIIGIAKRPDRLINADTYLEYPLVRGSRAMHLIQRLRDEAHRFAKKYHVSLRSKLLLTHERH